MTQNFSRHVAIVMGSSDSVGRSTARRPNKLDVTNDEALTAPVEDVAARHDQLDMLANNAISLRCTPISRLTLEHSSKDFMAKTPRRASKTINAIPMGHGGPTLFAFAMPKSGENGMNP